MNRFCLFILLVHLAQRVYCQVAPTWLNNSLVQAQKYKIIDQTVCNCFTTSAMTPTITLTFLTAFSSAPSLGYGASGMEGEENMAQLGFYINQTLLTSTSCSFLVRVDSLSSLWNMEIRFIAIAKQYPYHLNSFQNVPINYLNGALSNITSATSINRTYTNIINYTQQASSKGSLYRYFSLPLTNCKIVLFTTQLHLDANNENQIMTFVIDGTPLSAQTYSLSVLLGIHVSINYLEFSMIVFDYDQAIRNSSNFSFVSTRYEFTAAGGSYDLPSQFVNNFMIGLTEISDDSFKQYFYFIIQFVNISGVHKVSMPPSIPRNNEIPITRFNLQVLYLKTWLCPNGTVLDHSIDMCVPCPLSNCLTCFNYFYCSICDQLNGYFLNSTTRLCQLCILTGCLNCSTLTTCSTCDVSLNYILYANLTCLQCQTSLNYFANETTNTCQLCSLIQCLTCTSFTTCTLCNVVNNYFLNATICEPCNLTNCTICSSLTTCQTCAVDTFMNSTDNLCYMCTISNCTICSSLTTCQTCSINYLMNTTDNLCYPCKVTNCLTCNTFTTCSICQVGYVLNTTTELCDICTNATCPICLISNCISCPQSISVCQICDVGYQLSNNNCIQICGDFKKIGQQQCDDGNSQGKDGCSSTCTVQPDFVCQPHPTNSSGSICYFTGQITVSLVYIEKVNSQNKIEVILQYSPNDLAFWDSVDFISMVQLQSQVSLSGVQIVRNNNGTVTLSFYYAQDIQDQNISIQINPVISGLDSLQRATPSTYQFAVKPNDNQNALFYDSSVYRMANSISVLCTAISAIAFIFFILGLISGKMIGVEMMAVIQLSFFGLMSLTQMNPCFSALSSLRYVNGYNSLGTNHLEDKLSPTQAKGIFLFSRFAFNFNFTTLIVLIPLLVSLISLILWKTLLKDNQRVQKVFKRSLGEYTLNGILFSGYLISISFILQVQFGVKNTEGSIGGFSLAECIIFFILLIVYFFFLLFKPELFGEFTKSFKNDKLTSKYYCYMLVERFIVGICLVLMLTVNAETVIPLIVCLLVGVFVFVQKPYLQNHHNIRVIANMTVTSVIMIIYLAYRLSASENKKSQSAFLYLPIFVCVLLLIVVIYNTAALIYHLYKWIQKRRQNKFLQKQSDQILQLQKKDKLNTQSPQKTYPTQPDKSFENYKTNKSKSQKIKNELNLKEVKKEILAQKLNGRQVIKQQHTQYQLLNFKQNPLALNQIWRQYNHV